MVISSVVALAQTLVDLVLVDLMVEARAYSMGIEVDRCVYVDGLHLYPGKYCPHDQTEDALGPVIPAGWTIQSSPQPVERHDRGR